MGKVILTKLIEADLEMIRNWRNQNAQYFRGTSQITAEEHRTWYNSYCRGIDKLFYIVLYVEDGLEIAVGTISLKMKDLYKAEIHNVLLGNKQYEGKGIMSKALEMLMDTFPYNEYDIEVLKTNKAGLKFYEKNGFKIVEEKEDCYIMCKDFNYD